jgi:hypothetical protein
MARFLALAVLATLTFTLGCSKGGDGRQAVSGTIKLKGEPIEIGTINFTAKDITVGSSSGALISQGAYSIPAEQGLLPGVYIVRISAGKQTAAAVEAAPGEPGPLAEELVPAEYNANSQLEYVVKADGQNQFDFDIP